VTPPFKPVVESDESTANFDPEFTTANIREVGLAEMDLDDDDPSEAWVSKSISGSGFVHTPNGPLGSDRDERDRGATSPVSPLTPIGGHINGNGNGNVSSRSHAQGIRIASKKKRKDATIGSPLTNSVQEKFRGFTYSGGESFIPPPNITGQKEKDDEALEDDDAPEVTTEDEFDDFGTSMGRYANARRQGRHVDDDMNL
jgi:serine/threonine protein kinase SCH9